MRFVRWFSDVGLPDVGLVGGKNASLGELIRSLSPLGVRVPDGFAITAEAYRHFLREAGVEEAIRELVSGVKRDDVHDPVDRSAKIRGLITSAELPEDLREEALAAYRELCGRYSVESADVAVRSSATAEDLPGASFAGQQDTYLNVRGEEAGTRRGGGAGTGRPGPVLRAQAHAARGTPFARSGRHDQHRVGQLGGRLQADGAGHRDPAARRRHRRRNAGRRRRRRGRRALGVSSEAHSPITLMSTRFSRRPSNSP